MMGSSSTVMRTVSVKMFSLCRIVLFVCVSCSIFNKMSSAEDITSFFPEVKGNLSRVTWAHAVNNITYLESTLNNTNTKMIEADVILGTLSTHQTLPPLPIMAHPPANTSDLSLENFLKTVTDFNNRVNTTSSNTTEGPNISNTTTNNSTNNNSTNNNSTNAAASDTNISNSTGSTTNITNSDAAVSNSSISTSNNTDNSSSATAREIVQGTSRKGVKLDFKSIEVFNASIEILKRYSNVSFPLWLNADILPGPVNSTVTPVNPTQFLSKAKEFTTATLSLGWTTATNVNGSYTDAQIDSMIEIIKNHTIKNEITFAVRSALAAESLPQMKKLLSGVEGSTLTLWSAEDDKVDLAKLRNLIAEIGLEHIFIDVPEQLMKQLRLDTIPVKPNSATLISKTSWALSLLTFVLVLFA